MRLAGQPGRIAAAPYEGPRAEQLLLVLKIVRRTARTLEPDALFRIVVDAVHTQVPAFSHVSILQVDQSRDQVRVAAVAGDAGGKESVSAERLPWRTVSAALRSGTASVCNDTAQEKDGLVTVAQGSSAALCLPVRTGDRIAVLLNIESRQTGVFSTAEIALCEILCEQLADLLQFARLQDAIRHTKTQARRMTDLGRRMLAAGSLSEALDVAVRSVVKEHGYHSCGVALLCQDRSHFIVQAYDAVEPFEPRGGDRLQADQGLIGQVASSGRTIQCNELDREAWIAAQVPGAKARLCIPLAGDRLLGLLDITAAQPDSFTPEAISLMETLGGVLTLVIDKAEQIDQTTRTLMEDRRRAEQEREILHLQLLQSEKLSALGHLISGVAHELNNPLTGVIGYSQLLTGLECDERIRRGLERVYTEARRCHRVVQNLLTFARKHTPEKNYLSINDILESTIELRSYQMRVDDIEVRMELSRELPRTMGDFHQLQQVFMNLINNAHQAIHATGAAGTLTIRSRALGDLIRVEIADTGPGIPSEILKRIFDPFFTTKEPGQGTGLGLSICFGIIEEHEGRIIASSTVGEGTIFTVDLPVLRQNLKTRPAAQLPA